MCRWLLAVAISFSTLAVAPAADPAKLAEQLAHRDYHLREAAGKQLDALGAAALPALRHAIATGSPEAVRRAKALLRRITARLENKRILAPKLVTLDFRDADFKTVAAAIQKQTGYKLSIEGDGAKAKKLTIRMTKRPFWEVVGEVETQLGLEVDWYSDKKLGLLLCAPLGKTLCPTCDIYSVRVQVDRFPMDLEQLSTGVIPMGLSLHAEPGLELVEQSEIIITKAVTPEGMVLQFDRDSAHRAWEAQFRTHSEFRKFWAIQREANGIALHPDPALGHYLPSKEKSVLFRAPPGKPIAKLASVEGVVRGQVARIMPVTIPLNKWEDPWASADGPNSSQLKAKADGVRVLYLDVSFPENSFPQTMRDWVADIRTGHLRLLSAGGTEFELERSKPADGSPTEWSAKEGRVRTRLCFRYKYKPEQDPPTKLIWYARVPVEVEVPFNFTNLVVSPGTRDPKITAKEPVLKPIARERIHGGIGP